MKLKQNGLTNCSTLLTLVLLLLASIRSYEQTKKFKKIKNIIDQATKKHLAGVAVYIKMDGHQEWIGVSGFQELESKIKLVPENIFATGSIGKMYNAVAVLKLVEEGRLQLDDKISLYLPKEIVSNLPNGEQITIRHLLSNQTGLFNYETDPQLNELYLSGNLDLDTLSHENVLKRYVFGHTTKILPGTIYDYSSTNFMLIAMIVNSIYQKGTVRI